MNKNPLILVFDSGVGGLSVYTEIRKLLPNIRYIYTFDNVAFPYGIKSKRFIIERIVKILTAIQCRHSLALAVIACNTASIVSLSALREKFQFPIVGVVPAIKPAVHLTTNKIIGLLATHATVKRSYTNKLIGRFASKCQIEMLGSAKLVELAEDKLHGDILQLESLRKILRPWLNMLEPPDTIVLGCTHFPLLQDELLKVLPRKTRLIDSGRTIAHRVKQLLDCKALEKKHVEENIVYCMALTPKTDRFLPILHYYGFKKLKKLEL